MFFACLPVLQDRVEIDILKGMEDVAGDLTVRIRELRDELLDFEALGVRRAVRVEVEHVSVNLQAHWIK